MEIELPEDFDWKYYLENNSDLTEYGYKTEEEANKHYLKFGYKENRSYKNDRDRSDFFFIHVYKNLGTTIHSQLPQNYNKRFYGQITFREWEIRNNEKLTLKNYYEIDEKKSIDHIRIDRCKEIGILDDLDLEKRKFLGLIRNPIERFVSIYNFESKRKMVSLDDFFIDIKNRKKKVLQSDSIKTKYPIDLTLISVERKDLITDWFRQFDINLNFDIYLNVSKKKILESDLTNNQLKKIHEIFAEDFEIYNEITRLNGIKKYN